MAQSPRSSRFASKKSGLVLFAGLGLGAFGLTQACSSAHFGGSSSSPAKNGDVAGANSDGSSAPGGAPGTNASDAGTTNPASTSPGGTPCTKDQVTLDWTGDEKACIDQGQTWDFDTGKCMQIRKAQFDCTWANVLDAFSKKGLTVTTAIKTDSANGSKLVSCGQSQDGNRIVIQWIKVEDGGNQVSCTGGGTPLQHHVTTGCYTYYGSNPIPAPAATQAETDARVYACLGSI